MIGFLMIVILIFDKCSQQFDIEHYLDPFDSHPRLLVKNGHLVLLTGRNKDLLFRASGSGQIKINGNDFIASKLQSINSLESNGLSSKVDDRLPVMRLVEQKLTDTEMKINARIEQLTLRLNESLNYQKKMFSMKQFRRMRTLLKRMDRLEKLLQKNECEINPCQNGATCEDGFNIYYCRCQPGFKGPNCEQDVDECAQYQGTELGCQNGGTCLNVFGGFHCLCPPNHQGVRCNVEFNDCRNVSNHEICGQGLCLNLPRTQNNIARFRCVCYPGFTKANPTEDSSPCDTDLDECALGLDHCSRDPPVDCINIKGGYSCGPCPSGYSGDGIRCSIIDRCLINNGGCSTVPRVSCFSNQDRVICGPCPPGYAGNGFQCSTVDGDICSINNGGCSSDAMCISNSAISTTFRQCQCKVGFTGSGIGRQGCSLISQSCANNPCLNDGKCQQFNSEFFCLCTSEFTGKFCENHFNSCESNPCLNGAHCINNHGNYYCVCSNEFTGRNCEQARSSCGGELISEAGILAFPTNSSALTYANNVTCIWLIQNNVQTTKVLNITFIKFKIEKSPGCAFDYLEIFDGPSREYRNLGKFCGDKLPKGGNIVTSFNSLYIHFRSDPSISHEGFELSWSTINPNCGGTIINKTNGVLESPGYPHHYPANRDCHWEIIAAFGKRLQFIFTDLDIEPSTNCTFDYLIIHEGLLRTTLNTNANVISRYCNWTSSPEQPVPLPITTSGPFAHLHFHSDAGIHSRGFHLVFNEVPGVCGGILTGSSGIFQSPSTSYTSALTGRTFLVYENNVVCDWLIRVMPNERISLRFLSFALEADTMVNNLRNVSAGCLFDYVEVYDGETSQAPLRARLCGRIIPPEIISTGRFLRVKFRSDLSVALRGFIAKYQALCGGEYNELQGAFESPNYPASSFLSKNCTYQIDVPMNYIVRLEIEEMDIEFDHRCLFDYLMIHGEKYCGSLPPAPFFSMNNQLKVYYVSDDSKPSRGFRAKYQAIELGCGGVMKQGEPIVAISPERLTEQPIVNQCFWEIRANQSYVVMIKFFRTEIPFDNRIQLQSNQNCFDHYLLVNDSDGSLIKKFCVEELPPPISSTGNVLYVTYVFNVSQSENAISSAANFSTINNSTLPLSILQIFQSPNRIIKPKPFYATYHFMHMRAFCDKNLFKNNGVIRSPRFPRLYPNNRNCTWIIHVDNGLQISLNFTTFQMEPPSEVNSRCYDYLEIRNGRSADSPLIGQFCGLGPIPPIVSHGNYLFLRFITDPSMQNQGFELYYDSLSTGCGGTIIAESGSIESPGFPANYQGNSNCEWIVRVSEGSTIHAYIVQLKMEAFNAITHCHLNYLEIFDGDNDKSASLAKFCNDGSTPLIVTNSNKMFIKFVTDPTISNSGFKLNYRTECNRTILGRYGIIESPNYPNAHPHNLNCNWHILGPLGNNISIAFTQLMLENNVECRFDHINISEVIRSQPYSLAMADRLLLKEPYNLSTIMSLCGDHTGKLPPLIKTGRNEIIISFVSDESRSALQSGFRLEWSATGCGGELQNRPHGTISSPNYPNPYPINVECIWHIRAEPGHKIDLLIDELDLEFSDGCMFDSLQIFNGLDDLRSPSIAKLCYRASHVHLSSFGDSMTIKLVSDTYSTRRGFKATYRTTNLGCGGTYYVDNGIITSPNYGLGTPYDPHTDCSYKLLAEENFDIELSINDYQIPDSLNCSDSYLAIYDNDSDLVQSKLLNKLCGQFTKELKFRSSDSVLFIRFKSDGIHSGRGFNITYRKVCGKTIVINSEDDYREITSANYPHPFYNSECRFIIKAARPEDHITFRFTHIDIDQLDNLDCQFMNAVIYEGQEESEHKRLQKICSTTIPPPVTSTGDSLLIVVNFALFRALASSVQSFCGGDFHTIEGFIANPGYPNSYPLNVECIWLLEAAPGNRFKIEFVDFDIEISDYCNNDYLEIRLNNSSGPIIGDKRLCGLLNTIDKPIIDMPGNLWIKFRTDDVGVAKGFLLYFSIAHNVMLSSNSGMIGSPGWPNGYSFYNLTYLWYIVVPHNHYVKIEFIDFGLYGEETQGHCPFQLSIFNGLVDFSQISSHSSLVNDEVVNSFQYSLLPKPKLTLCGQIQPKNFIADSNAITLMYSNEYPTYTRLMSIRFLLKWSAINVTDYTTFKQSLTVPDEVNSTFNLFIDHGQMFNLLSNNYSSYGNDINWYFRTKQSMHLNITVSRLQFEPINSCWQNKMTVYTWHKKRNKWFVQKTLCKSIKEPIEIFGNEFRIHLQYSKYYDEVLVKTYYNLTITPVCGGNFTRQPNGQIDSSEDVDERKHGMHECHWIVEVRPGRVIRFHVDYYSIGLSLDSPPCQIRGEVLEIHNGQSIDSPMLVKPMCGYNTSWFVLPETSTNYAYVVYKSKRPTNYFRLRYEEIGIFCGGELIIENPTDIISIYSPGYPDSPKHDIVCEWIVRGPLNYGLQITFKSEKWSICNLNNSYVEIFNGGSDLSGLVEKVCVPAYNQNTITIDSHITFIRYVVQKTDFQSRFNATIMLDNCNREYFVAFGSIYHLTDSDLYQFPKFFRSPRVRISPELKCSLKLRTHANFYITLNLTYVNLEGNNCGSGDIIDFKNDIDERFSLQTICPPKNTSIQGEITSTTNEMYIQYQRINFDSGSIDMFSRNNQPIGIKFYAIAKYQKCSKLINMKESQSGVLNSPNYPKAIPRRLSCSWVFYTEPRYRIRLFFQFFDLGELPPDKMLNKGKTLRCNKILLISRNVFISRNLMQKYGCSRRKPKIVHSLSNFMSVHMYASDLEMGEGFRLAYSTVYDNDSCSDLWRFPNGSFKSSNFDNLNETGLIGCAWEMEMHKNQSGSLVLDTFDVPGDCSNSTLSIGYYQIGTQSFSGRNVICIPPHLLPQKNHLKYVVPIYRELHESLASNPTVFVNFNRSKEGIYKGIRGEYFIQNCGGYFDANLEHEFFSPKYPGDYPDPTFCHWSFRRVNLDYELENIPGYKLTFLELNFEFDCEKSYFLLQVNPRHEWQGSEKICPNSENRLPSPFYLTHDILLSFISSANLSLVSKTDQNSFNGPRKFHFKIEPISHGCGGRLMSFSGYFQSPNYSNASDVNTFEKTNHQYSNSIECVWIIRAIPDFHLEFDFVSRFDLEQSDDCKNDYLLFEQQTGDNDLIELAKLCGHKQPERIVSQSDLVQITFRSNDKIAGDGFRVMYEQKCGAVFYDESGFIYSPNFSKGGYSNELICIYKIERPHNEYIQISFEVFELEQHSTCMFDSVDIYLGDHQNNTVPHYGPYCGSLTPPTLSSQQLITIVFHSDHFITKRGFKIRYNVTKCGGNLTSEEGLIISPFNTNRNCYWYITLPDPKMLVALKILELNLENDHCPYDCCNYLEIAEDANYSIGKTLANLCTNSSIDFTFKSSSNHMTIFFRRALRNSPNQARFRLQYWSSPGPSLNCGGHFLNQKNGVIVTPDLNGDSYYEPRLDCLWIITGSSDEIVTLEFERFDVANVNNNPVLNTGHQKTEEPCKQGDHLNVFDGVSLHSQQLTILCGTNIPEKLVSSGNSMLLQFLTNQDNYTGHGFRAHFKIEQRYCGGVVVSQQTPNVLTSPGYPVIYQSPQQCSWEFASLHSYPLIFKFEDLNLNCTRGDYLQIIQYRYENFIYRPITLCSSTSSFKIISSINSKIRLIYKTFTTFIQTQYDNLNITKFSQNRNLLQNFRGFNLTHHISFCNESLNGLDNGYITNLRYPHYNSIYTNVFCQINITVSEDRQLTLYFNSFDFYLCSYSNMTILDGNGKVMATYCDQRTIPNPIFSTWNKISILIQARHQPRIAGTPMDIYDKQNRILYSLSYTSLPKSRPPGCGGNLTSLQGQIASPNYPQPFMLDESCQWIISTNGYHTITLTFNFFTLAPPCDKHYLSIYDGIESIDENKLATFCLDDKPAPIHSLSNTVLVKFSSSVGNYEAGFLASFKTNQKEPSLNGRIITKDTFHTARINQDFQVLTVVN